MAARFCSIPKRGQAIATREISMKPWGKITKVEKNALTIPANTFSLEIGKTIIIEGSPIMIKVLDRKSHS